MYLMPMMGYVPCYALEIKQQDRIWTSNRTSSIALFQTSTQDKGLTTRLLSICRNIYRVRLSNIFVCPFNINIPIFPILGGGITYYLVSKDCQSHCPPHLQGVDPWPNLDQLYYLQNVILQGRRAQGQWKELSHICSSALRKQSWFLFPDPQDLS